MPADTCVDDGGTGLGDAPADSFEWSKGPTGFGVRILLDWLGSADPLSGIGRQA